LEEIVILFNSLQKNRLYTAVTMSESFTPVDWYFHVMALNLIMFPGWHASCLYAWRRKGIFLAPPRREDAVKINRIRNGCAALLATLLLCGPVRAYAGPYTASPGLLAGPVADLVNGNILIIVDENGHGTINGFGGVQQLPFALQNDPGPGGRRNVLTYSLLNPPRLRAGDVAFDAPGTLEPDLLYGGDLIRFNRNETCAADGSIGCLVFYSDNTDGSNDLADGLPPRRLRGNVAHIAELGTEAFNFAIYTPVRGEPGFVRGADAPVTYIFISDIPEPASLAILLTGMAGLGLARIRRRRNRS
jgi:hypothetical protein